MATTMEIGKKLVELCNQGKFTEAMNTLYGDDIVSVEAMTGPNMPGRMEGIAAVRKKAEWWEQNHEVHNAEAQGPWPHGDRFIVWFILDVTAKTGPMAGRKMHMDEVALYTVKNGKIVHEEFFYDMGG